LTLTSFSDFGLAEPIQRALAEEDYRTPTPIQAQTIPFVLENRDVVGIAQTGTGKTAAFALPIIHRLQADPRRTDRKTCRVLVLSPTRELSGQIETSFRTYGRHVKLSTTLAIGGVSMGKQVRSLMDGVDVLVATPGRLLDLVQSNALKLSAVEVLVLDEADRMLDMGFIHDIRKIVAKLPKDRQTLFFSATMPKAIAELAEHMLRNPAKVAVTPAASTAERVSQRVIHVDRAAKPQILADLLRNESQIGLTLVFTRTKHGADKVVRSLERAGLSAAAIHGNKSQGQRERVLASFRSGQLRTLVATDIAARGIDVDGITHVINYDLPNIPETYVHRIGRTARAGADGVAISLVDHEERAFLRDIEKLIRMPIDSERRMSTQPEQRDEPARRSEQPRRQGRGRQEGERRQPNGQRQRNGERPQNGQRQANAKRQPNGPRQASAQHSPAEQGPSRSNTNGPVHFDDLQRPRTAKGQNEQRPGGRKQALRKGQRHGQDSRPEERQRNEGQSQRGPRQQRDARPQSSHDSGISAVAFMQRQPRREHAPDRAPR
jgi:ATP-dependent RNA helicase RhlE